MLPKDSVRALNPFILTSVSVIIIYLLDKSDRVSENKPCYQIVFIYDFVISCHESSVWLPFKFDPDLGLVVKRAIETAIV
jgi:hypothetical protein